MVTATRVQGLTGGPSVLRVAAQASIVISLIALLYHSVFTRLVINWWSDASWSHGFLIPPFSAYIAWKERGKLATLSRDPSPWGLAIIAFASGLLLLGTAGSELFLARVSFLILLWGLSVFFLGWNHFRVLLFPWACLFLMIPVPAIVFNRITFPLQLLASRLASSMLASLGVPVLREGNILQLASISLEVVEACSGIRSLVTLITLVLVYSYFFERRKMRRFFLVLAAVPVAVLANSLRIVGTGLVAHYLEPEKAEGFLHAITGMAVFVLAMALILGLHQLMGVFDSRGRKEPT
jgi:exosortase